MKIIVSKKKKLKFFKCFSLSLVNFFSNSKMVVENSKVIFGKEFKVQDKTLENPKIHDIRKIKPTKLLLV